MTKWATVSDGIVRRVSAVKQHPDALPVVYDPPADDRVENDIRQADMAEWIVGQDGVTVTYTVTPRDLASEKLAMKERARDMRWQIETGGITVNGAQMSTDERSQAKVNGMVTTLLVDPDLASIDFEAQPGQWVTLDRATAMTLGLAVTGHVQACFSHCRALHDQIDAGTTVADVWGVDIRSGWPGQE